MTDYERGRRDGFEQCRSSVAMPLFNELAGIREKVVRLINVLQPCAAESELTTTPPADDAVHKKVEAARRDPLREWELSIDDFVSLLDKVQRQDAELTRLRGIEALAIQLAPWMSAAIDDPNACDKLRSIAKAFISALPAETAGDKPIAPFRAVATDGRIVGSFQVQSQPADDAGRKEE